MITDYSKYERPLFADIYPAGERACVKCGRKNVAGESFSYVGFTGHYCTDCKKVHDLIQQDKKRAEVRTGERDTDNEDEITCPYCGYEFSDSWEYLEGNREELGEIECHDCEKTFTCSANYSVSFSTERLEEDDEEDVEEEDLD